jgi:hypothetical protein
LPPKFFMHFTTMTISGSRYEPRNVSLYRPNIQRDGRGL